MPIFPSSSSHKSIRFKKTVTVANTNSDNSFEYHNGLLDEFGFANNYTQHTNQTHSQAYLSGFYRGLTSDASFASDKYDTNTFSESRFILRYDASKPEGSKYATILRDYQNGLTVGKTTHPAGAGQPENGFYGDFRGAFSRGLADTTEVSHYTSGGLYDITNHANGVVDANYFLKEKIATYQDIAPGMVIDGGVVKDTSEKFMQKMDVPRGEANNVFFAIESTHEIPTHGNTIKFSDFRNKGKNLKQWEIPSLMGYLAANNFTSQERARNDFVADPYDGIFDVVGAIDDDLDFKGQNLVNEPTRRPITTYNFGIRKGTSSPSTLGSSGYRHHHEKTRNTKHTTLVFHHARLRPSGETSTSSNVLTQLKINEFVSHINNNLELDRLSAGDYLAGLTDFTLGGSDEATKLISMQGWYADRSLGIYAQNPERQYDIGSNNMDEMGHSEFSYIHLDIPYSDLARVKSQHKDLDPNWWNSSSLLVLPGKWEPADLTGSGGHYLRNGNRPTVFSDESYGYRDVLSYPCKYGDIVLHMTASDHQSGSSQQWREGRSTPSGLARLISSRTTPNVKAHQFSGTNQWLQYSGGCRMSVQSIHDKSNPKLWGTAAGTYTTYAYRDQKPPNTYFGGYGQTQIYPPISTDNQISVMRYIEP